MLKDATASLSDEEMHAALEVNVAKLRRFNGHKEWFFRDSTQSLRQNFLQLYYQYQIS
jgi:hypothetical protein